MIMAKARGTFFASSFFDNGNSKNASNPDAVNGISRVDPHVNTVTSNTRNNNVIVDFNKTFETGCSINNLIRISASQRYK